VNDTTETIATLDVSLAPRRRQQRTCRARRREGQRSMWPVAVVMRHEDIEDPSKMLVIQDGASRDTLTERCVRTAPPHHSPVARETVFE
jgi:hypothetical protein